MFKVLIAFESVMLIEILKKKVLIRIFYYFQIRNSFNLIFEIFFLCNISIIR